MNISITFRHMDATEAVKVYATEKLAKLQRFLRWPMKGQVTLSCQHDRLNRVEVEIHAGHERFHAHETSEDMYASIDKVSDKIERQIVSAKDAVTGQRKGAERAAEHLSQDTRAAITPGIREE
ncbi:MAG: ribosome hibernation-promoting factor, HPF/YfiA family [Polyangiaceae bacterium]